MYFSLGKYIKSVFSTDFVNRKLKYVLTEEKIERVE